MHWISILFHLWILTEFNYYLLCFIYIYVLRQYADNIKFARIQNYILSIWHIISILTPIQFWNFNKIVTKLKNKNSRYRNNSYKMVLYIHNFTSVIDRLLLTIVSMNIRTRYSCAYSLKQRWQKFIFAYNSSFFIKQKNLILLINISTDKIVLSYVSVRNILHVLNIIDYK